MAEPSRPTDQHVAEEQDREPDVDKPTTEERQAEAEADVSGSDDADEEAGESEQGADSDAEPEEEPPERLHADTLIARYRLLGGPTGYLLPWSWSDLPPGETEALVEVIDGFVGSYNNLWALTDADTVPPCWHHHAALAHDLAALAWAYFQAYRDPNATPDLALRFQAHLPGFRERMDYWLGANPAECRDGRHSRSWRTPTVPVMANPRDSTEERDAVVLLGADDLGFPRAAGAPGE